jgi:hypothetical protein
LRSKKQSAASSRSKRPKLLPPPLFIDRSLGRLVIPAALREQGVEVHTHDAHFAQDAPDADWLSSVGARGWTVITKDTKIRYRHTELAALVAGRVRAFVLTKGDLSGPEMARILILALPRIGAFCVRHEAPFRAT